MALLLSLETSSQACSVALHKNGLLVGFKEIDTPRSAASQLAVMIRDVINGAERKPADLKGIVVASGPGSYTGLRIGVATAKGLCYALNIPLIAINTLQLLAHQAKDLIRHLPHDNALICPMLDARRMEVYCALLDSGLKEIEPTQAKVMDENSFESHLKEKVIYFIGEGAEKCKAIIRHPNARFISEVTPQAARLGELGYTQWMLSAFEDVVSFEPFYLKDFLIRKPNLA